MSLFCINLKVHYTAIGRHRGRIAGTILQGAVSDRDYAEATDDSLPKWLDQAKEQLRQEKPDYMPAEAYADAPITPLRFLSLFGRGGPDDMFSRDLSTKELEERLGHLGSLGDGNVLFFFSEDDEYVPHLPLAARELGQRIAAAAGGAEAVFLKGADHAVSSPRVSEHMLTRAKQFLSRLVKIHEPSLCVRYCWTIAKVRRCAVLPDVSSKQLRSDMQLLTLRHIHLAVRSLARSLSLVLLQ